MHLKNKKNEHSHSTIAHIQVGEGTVEQVEDSIVHTHLRLIGNLEKVPSTLHLAWNEL